MQALQKPTTGQIARYVVLPGIMPRMRRLFGGGFAHLAFGMAQVYALVRLLPPGHPYLAPAHFGKYGVRHVIAEAANHLTLDWRHADQIVVFAALGAGIVLLATQFAMMAYFLFVPQAAAMGVVPGAGSMFYTPDPTDDVALNMLGYTFGVPDFFCTGGLCPAVDSQIPFPFHTALHALFGFYSNAILMIGVLIFLYFTVVVVVETAVSGTPFGERFQHWWVPLRFVIAIGLLVPLGSGLNSGQYIVLYAAKAGSGWATNAWIGFNDTMNGRGVANPLGESGNLVALPGNQEAAGMVEAVSLVKACIYGYEEKMGLEGADTIKPYLTKMDDRTEVTPTMTYKEAVEWSGHNDIIITFGIYDEARFKTQGYVSRTCGEIRVPVTDLRDLGQGSAKGGGAYMREFYWNTLVNGMLQDARIEGFAARMVETNVGTTPHEGCSVGCGVPGLAACAAVPATGEKPACFYSPGDASWKQTVINDYQARFNAAQRTAWRMYNALSVADEMRAEVLSRGWAFSGAWYHQVAEQNAAFQSGLGDVPELYKRPQVMLEVAAERAKMETLANPMDIYNPMITPTQMVVIPEHGEQGSYMARGLYAIHKHWRGDQADQARSEDAFTGNAFTMAVKWLFGLDGLLAMRGENANSHPLAQLTAVGRGLVESTIRNLMISTGAGAGQALFGGLPIVPQMLGIVDSMLSSTAFVGLTAGITLYYILPFLPFMMVFFAAGSWLKELFEAMVAVPLWALAHLRIDGEGLPGEAAQNGYFLIFGIFLRPILTVVGLIAAIVILGVQVRILHFIWDLVVDNLTGFDTDNPAIPMGMGIDLGRGEIDALAFTIVYVVIVYMLANAAFKLIDTIPDGILRWMGTEVPTFSDKDKNPTEGLVSYAAMGGMTLGQQVVQGASGSLKGIVGGLMGRKTGA